MSQPIAVDILSDDDDDGAVRGGQRFERLKDVQSDPVFIDISTPVTVHLKKKKKQRVDSSTSDANPTTLFIIDDDPTPRKVSLDSAVASTSFTATPSFVAETPFARDASTDKCSRDCSCSSSAPLMAEDTPISELSKPKLYAAKCSGDSPGNQKLSFVAETPMSELSKGNHKPSVVADTPMSELLKYGVPLVRCNEGISSSQPVLSSAADYEVAGISGLIYIESDNESEEAGLVEASKQFETSFAVNVANELDWSSRFTDSAASLGNCNVLQTVRDNLQSNLPEAGASLAHSGPDSGACSLPLRTSHTGERGKCKVNSEKCRAVDEEMGKKRMTKEEKNQLKEEKKQQKEQEKLQKAAEKAEAAEMKKLQKEKQKWEKGKLALKSIVAEIDTGVVELSSIGGHLLTRFAEKDVSYRITSNPFKRSIVWTMTIPEHIAQISSEETEVRYILLVYDAEEFCNLIINESFMDHVFEVQSRYPNHTICYLTNRLMAYINKREQLQYKNPANCISWSRPPVEEVLSKLTTHFTKVHTRQCIDEAEVAEHVVGLTCSLATCQFRKRLTRLSVNANGAIIPKDCVERNLIKKNIWLKMLVAIPKVQPRFAIAIWKKYPTMKSLLSVYMDPSKTVHEKEFLLQDLITEGLLGDDRRLGEVCSKRVYRILTAQCGNITTDDAENGADFFSRQST